MQPLFLIFLFIVGACLGSFSCCQARRLRFKDLESTHPNLGKRSVCLHCQQSIKWYDNLPLFSWLFLRGRCRHCRTKIGLLEPVSEFGFALSFLMYGIHFDFLSSGPLEWAIFLLSLLLICLLGFLAIYDSAYSELPTLVIISSIICAILILILKQVNTFQFFGWDASLILSPLFSVIILAGTYLSLYLVSKGRWVGDGDWLLGLSLGLALANPWLALLVLCLANLLACLTALPFYRHLKPRTRIPLGPFLVAAFIIIYSFQNFFLNLI